MLQDPFTQIYNIYWIFGLVFYLQANPIALALPSHTAFYRWLGFLLKSLGSFWEGDGKTEVEKRKTHVLVLDTAVL